MRTCSNGVYKRAGQVGRPCLLGYIGKCAAPCVGRITQDEHHELAQDFCDFMAGQTGRFVKRIEAEMRAASTAMEYEKAARLRDDLGALNRALERSAVVLPDGTDADVFALAEDELEAAVQVFHVRGGRVRGQRGWVVEKVEDVGTDGLVEHLLQQVYGESPESVPREVLVPALPPDAEQVTAWLTGLRGANVDLRVPQRGDKRTLLETVQRNAGQGLTLHKTRRAGDLTTRSQALQEPAGRPRAARGAAAHRVLRRLAHPGVGGRRLDGGLRGRPAPQVRVPHLQRARHRRPGRHGVDARGDGAAAAPPARRPRRGRRRARRPHRPRDRPTQAVRVPAAGSSSSTAARRRSRRRRPRSTSLAVDDIALVGLAKRLEEVWLPGDDHPVVLPRTSEGLYLLQRVRDEAHRFAITSHRRRRSKKMTTSALDDVPGLGQTRRAALLKHFGSLKKPAGGRRRADRGRAGHRAGDRRRGRGRPRRVAARTRRQRHDGRGARRIGCTRRRGPAAPQPAGPARPRPPESPPEGDAREPRRSRAARARHRHRHVQRRSLHRGVRAGGPRLVRRRQPAAAPAADDARRHVGTLRGRPAAWRRWSTSAAGRSSRRCASRSPSLRERGVHPRVVFLDASDDVLVRRQESVRRPHPLQGHGRILDGIHRERRCSRTCARTPTCSSTPPA
ncbi:hypothetical protein GCM10025868_02680 [Angustibacter aerolatus]|uniref:UvrABC system protein C n=1 Tax=Angustibacter aerolatus TaxID=1162965 RepID=A0ABQ6JA17_9ACTN|nr:hypothetical protein GCM10025868_02680 [Angustibacter aerolatus]